MKKLTFNVFVFNLIWQNLIVFRIIKLSILAAVCAFLLLALWAVAERPQKVDMAAYVPEETLAYLEINDLPAILQAFTGTDAWQELAPKYKIDRDWGNFGWFNQFLAAAHLGSTETVVLGRSQIAVALLGVSASGVETTLKIKPSYAVVIEAQSSRIGDFVEKQIGRFAKQQFGETRTEKIERENAQWTVFRAVQNEKQIFAAVQNTTAVIGNDEQAVQACLDAKNGKRKSLIENEKLAESRANVDAESSFVFGLVTTQGVKEVSEIGAIFAAGQLTEKPAAISLLTQSLPDFVNKTVISIAWAARPSNGKIEDRFLIETPKDVVARLREPFAAKTSDLRVADSIPANVQSVNVYSFANPQAAWRAFVLAIIAKLDTMSAAVFSEAAGNLLEPYGVQEPNVFLAAVNGEIATVKLSENENSTVALAHVRETEAAEKSLGQNSVDKQSEFLGDLLALGNAHNLEIVRLAREQNQVIKTKDYWQNFVASQDHVNPAFVRTLSQDFESPVQFVKNLAREKNRNNQVPVETEMPLWAWTTTETRLVRDGFERRTSSAFGFVATLIARFNNREN